MARVAHSAKIYGIAAQFQASCLQVDGSLLFENDPVWSLANLEDLYHLFVESSDTGDRSFLEKFQDQLAKASRGTIRLAAEVILVHFLFPSNVTGFTKRKLVRTVLQWANDHVDDDYPAMAVLDRGVGSGGHGYNTRRPTEIKFVINVALKLKRLQSAEQASVFASAWSFRDTVGEVEGADSSQFRHMLLHLLFPDEFERIASGVHKWRLERMFHDLADEKILDRDERIYAIRKRLEELLPNETLDFYEAPLVAAWNPQKDEDGAEEMVARDALLHKKQIVLYGPPGTGKTHQAKELAEDLIRSAALQQHGAAWYFQNQAAVDQAAKDHTRRLQLHPGYSYEDFIRGLHVGEGGKTEYRLGYLPRLVNTIAKERETADPVAALPYVLILDEMNRTDLSRLLGECFSLLEDRCTPIDLPGLDADQKALTLALPKDLYVIGTMNLIDQSIEQIDFALRRRFLWQPSRFSAEALVRICAQRWTAEPGGPHDWNAVRVDFERLGAAATALNTAIHESQVLGEQYEIGHTYFFDVVAFLRLDVAWRKRRRASYLWKKGKPENVLFSLWRLSLEPLLREYLRGLEERARKKELDRLEKAFLSMPADVDE